MALVIKDRVRETTSSTGTGAITLGGPYTGFQGFSAIGDGNTTYYAISDPNTGDWEVGVGTYTLSGNTLSRDTVLASTNSGSLVAFSAGTKDVICTQPAERAVYLDTATHSTIPNVTTGALVATTISAQNGIFVNSATVTEDQTIVAGTNAGSYGPITVGSGVTVTVESGAVWTVV